MSKRREGDSMRLTSVMPQRHMSYTSLERIVSIQQESLGSSTPDDDATALREHLDLLWKCIMGELDKRSALEQLKLLGCEC